MHQSVGGADVSPSSLSLLALKPRQVLLAELRRNSGEATPMAKTLCEDSVQLKAREEFILTCSIALWLENKGFSKVLKRFISAVQIQGDDWKASALNLNDIFSEYLENCNNLHKDRNPEKKPEDQGNASVEKNGDANSAVSEEIANKKKKKKKIEDISVTNTRRTTEETALREKVNESNLNPKSAKICRTSGTPSLSELKSKEESSKEKVCDLTVESVAGLSEKQKDKKKNKSKSELRIVDEKTINAVPEVTEEKHNAKLSIGNDDSGVMVKSKDEKKKKKLKGDDLTGNDINRGMGNKNLFSDNKASDIELIDRKVQAEEKSGKKKAKTPLELTIPGSEALDSENLIDNKSKKESVKDVGDVVNESKKFSKKRKRLISDENGKLPMSEVAIEESKRRKIKDVDPQIALPGANGHADGQNKEENIQVSHVGSENLSAKQNGEGPNGYLNYNGAEKLGETKSAKKKKINSAEPKSANAFQRVKIDEVKFVDEKLQDNSYWAKDGAENGYGAKAQEVLGQVKGRDFRLEKTKKKRGSFRGGQIDLQSHSIKFNYSDEE